MTNASQNLILVTGAEQVVIDSGRQWTIARAGQRYELTGPRLLTFEQAIGEIAAWTGDGCNEYLTDGVRRALGRAPRDFAEYAHDAAATGMWNRTGSTS
jgi:hypothetical protein